MKQIFLIDANALIYRSYYAFIKHPLINSKGVNTSAIYGTLNAVLKIIDKFNPEFMAVSFDLKGPTFRKDISDDYKANRKPMPDDLIPQIEPIRRFFQLIDVPEFSQTEYEADDMLASITEYFKKDAEIILITGDKDFMQLIDKNVKVFNPFKEITFDEEAVYDKYGIYASQFIDYLAIMGDSADNIPGVKGIGPKGAQKLLSQYKTLENIYENLDEIRSKSTVKKLEKFREDAFCSRELAKMVCDIPIENLTIERISFHSQKLQNAIPLLDEFELSRIKEKIDITKNEDSEEEEIGVNFESILINNDTDFINFLTEIEKHEILAIDTETTSLDYYFADLVGVSIAFNKHKGFYISLGHQMADNVSFDLFQEKFPNAIKHKLLIGHNLKYDFKVFVNNGIKLDNKIFDTMIASYVLNPGNRRHNLDACAEIELDYKMKPISDLIGKGKKQITFDKVFQNEALFYAVEDAVVALQLYKIYKTRLEQQNLSQLFADIEIPLVKVLQKMEETGVFIDKNELHQLSDKFQNKITDLTNKIYEIAGYQFNLNSTQQLSKVLFEDLEIKPIKKTKTGYSTNSAVLEKLAEKHEIAQLMLEYRQLAKLESTYTLALQKLINPKSGRVHTSFNQAVTSTGRLSSTNPNLQNIPIRTPEGSEIRRAFSAPNNDVCIIAADYSQIELRLMALFSKDPNMLVAYQNDQDIHSQTAAVIFDKKIVDVSKEDRRSAKVINFGLLYGMGARKLSQELKISQKEASAFIETYFEKFPTIKEFRDESVNLARKDGFASTLFGRKLYLPELTNPSRYSKMQVSGAERVAVNMPIQGTAADLIKIAMINIDNEVKDKDWIKMMIQVHDELVFEVDKNMVEKAMEIIREKMESALPQEYRQTIHLKVDINSGANWLEAH